MCAGLVVCYKRPVLFLNRELREMFLETDLMVSSG